MKTLWYFWVDFCVEERWKVGSRDISNALNNNCANLRRIIVSKSYVFALIKSHRYFTPLTIHKPDRAFFNEQTINSQKLWRFWHILRCWGLKLYFHWCKKKCMSKLCSSTDLKQFFNTKTRLAFRMSHFYFAVRAAEIDCITSDACIFFFLFNICQLLREKCWSCWFFSRRSLDPEIQSDTYQA